jgi:hypothetical protein
MIKLAVATFGALLSLADSAAATTPPQDPEAIAELAFAAWAETNGGPVTNAACHVGADTTICYGLKADNTVLVASAAPDGTFAPVTPSAPVAPGDSGGDVGSRQNPIPLGTAAALDANWTLIVNSVNLDATEQIMATEPFNEAPPEGSVYVLVNITVTYTGTVDNQSDEVLVSAVTNSNVEINWFDSIVIAPDFYDPSTSFFPGGSKSGNLVFTVPAAEAQSLILLGTTFLGDQTVYFATQ